jgi:Ras-related GTP-binding protein C/D
MTQTFEDEDFIQDDVGHDFSADMGYEPGTSVGAATSATLQQRVGSMTRQPAHGTTGGATAAAPAAGMAQPGEVMAAGGGGGGAADGSKPHILLFGLKRSGKSSILRVVFNKLSPHETKHLESTKSIEKANVGASSFIKFDVWDFPGQLDWDPSFDDAAIFGPCGALIWVCDAQEDYTDSLRRFLQTIARAYVVNPTILFELFIHKVDSLSDDHKIERQQDIQRRCNDSLHEAGLGRVQFATYLTSIYDHSVFDAFSKVIQKLTPQLSTLETLLDSFTANSGIERAFLADIATKIYLVSDQSHGDMSGHVLCSDMIDVVTDILSIYVPTGDAAAAGDGDEEDGVESIIRLTDGMVLYLRSVD